MIIKIALQRHGNNTGGAGLIAKNFREISETSLQPGKG
jgi:hypothetical protein